MADREEYFKTVDDHKKVKLVRVLNRHGLNPTVISAEQGRKAIIMVSAPKRGLARWLRRHGNALSNLNFPRFAPKTEQVEA